MQTSRFRLLALSAILPSTQRGLSGSTQLDIVSSPSAPSRVRTHATPVFPSQTLENATSGFLPLESGKHGSPDLSFVLHIVYDVVNHFHSDCNPPSNCNRECLMSRISQISIVIVNAPTRLFRKAIERSKVIRGIPLPIPMSALPIPLARRKQGTCHWSVRTKRTNLSVAMWPLPSGACLAPSSLQLSIGRHTSSQHCAFPNDFSFPSVHRSQVACASLCAHSSVSHSCVAIVLAHTDVEGGSR
jgi:hypothetical protein